MRIQGSMIKLLYRIRYGMAESLECKLKRPDEVLVTPSLGLTTTHLIGVNHG